MSEDLSRAMLCYTLQRERDGHVCCRAVMLLPQRMCATTGNLFNLHAARKLLLILGSAELSCRTNINRLQLVTHSIHPVVSPQDELTETLSAI
ncbi:hypothetical protein ILYODFUR_024812 [Ilyodon furcidens]|uniref:Uncharacterized protein n=1 Tax=Ilyodon furcidens TaxID=33524 RepID=A0ABV0U881_9TELE